MGTTKSRIAVLLFIATEKGYACLHKLIISQKNIKIRAVVTFKDTNIKSGYDVDIIELARQNNIPNYYWHEIKDSLEDFIVSVNPQIVFAVGWRYLLPLSINKNVQYGLIVFHDSLLPKYRGFAPTPTAIICGEKEVGVTALIAARDVDAGPIVAQRKIRVEEDEYVQSVIEKQALACAEMLSEVLLNIENGTFKGIEQNEEEATYSIWRDSLDYEIDWRDSDLEIYNFVRALAFPYAGAYTYYKGRKIIIDKVERWKELDFCIRQPGKIWKIEDGNPVIICGKGMIKIISAHSEADEDVIFDRLRERVGNERDTV